MNISIEIPDILEQVMSYYEHLEYNMALITINEFKLSKEYSEYKLIHKMILYSLEILMHYRLRKFESYIKVFNEMELHYSNFNQEIDPFSQLTYWTHKIIYLCQTKHSADAGEFVVKGNEMILNISDDFEDPYVARFIIFYYYALGWYKVRKTH